MIIRFMTWNVNSVRVRLPHLRQLTLSHRPDVLCLQETKVVDEDFPHQDLHDMGYHHRHVAGMKSYNGVAIVSRLPLDDVAFHDCTRKNDKRHISAVVAGVACHCLYLPAGGDIPDVTVNERFRYKFDYLSSLTPLLRQVARKRKAVVLGDFNIAPLAEDVWNHKALLKVISHTPAELVALEKMRAEGAWCDGLRLLVPPPVRLYSWWSYRSSDFRRADRGRRLDLIWVSPDLKQRVRGGGIMRQARAWQKPSDHVPVWIDVAVA